VPSDQTGTLWWFEPPRSKVQRPIFVFLTLFSSSCVLLTTPSRFFSFFFPFSFLLQPSPLASPKAMSLDSFSGGGVPFLSFFFFFLRIYP